jgi:hypothetical protein
MQKKVAAVIPEYFRYKMYSSLNNLVRQVHLICYACYSYINTILYIVHVIFNIQLTGCPLNYHYGIVIVW